MRLKTCLSLCALQAALVCGTKLVPRLPKGPLKWGDSKRYLSIAHSIENLTTCLSSVNIIHTSDTHGMYWLHSGDLFLSTLIHRLASWTHQEPVARAQLLVGIERNPLARD
jgi:hypothetical protein